MRLARSNLLLERERDNKLMNVEATMAAIAHEVRQPLAAIVANGGAALRFLTKVPPDQDEVRAALNRIVSDGHRTGEVLDGLRALFRKSDPGKQPVDVNKIIFGVLLSLRRELNDHGVELRSDLSPKLPLVDGHGSQLEEVISNLVHNATEAMDATTDRSRVLRVISEPRADDAIAVTVQDSGPGIDPKRISGIFTAFITTKSQGTGWGLAICRMIIEHHGGQLTASSDGKNGASFQFVLPTNHTEAISASQPYTNGQKARTNG
jgi:C4-dicarboxylate-specific signal transduction histidine kinase